MIEKLDLQRVCEMSQAVSDAVELLRNAEEKLICCRLYARPAHSWTIQERRKWESLANDYETTVIKRLKLRAKRKAEELNKFVDSLT